MVCIEFIFLNCLLILNGGNLVVFVIWFNIDYYFYCLDNDGIFFYKLGQMVVWNVDNFGEMI